MSKWLSAVSGAHSAVSASQKKTWHGPIPACWQTGSICWTTLGQFDTQEQMTNEILTGSMCHNAFLSHKWIRFKNGPKTSSVWGCLDLWWSQRFREIRREKKGKGVYMEKGIVCHCLCQGLNMWLRLKREAYCLCCGFQFQWQNKLQQFLLVRKIVFAYAYLSWYLVCVYARLQNRNPHTWRNMYMYTGSWFAASSLDRIERLQ